MKTHAEHLELRRALNAWLPNPGTPIELDRLSKGKLKKAAWRLCSFCVRLEAMESDGKVTCVTCGARGNPIGDGMQAGHVVAGRCNAILFDRRGIAVQDTRCNMLQSGMHAEFVRWMDTNRPGVVDDLIAKKHGPSKTFQPDEYIELIMEYELELAQYL